jgi:NADH-quinone oxidoreductase subunit N
MTDSVGMRAEAMALLPELVLLAGAVLGLLLGLWTPQRRQARVRVLTVVTALASAVAAAVALGDPDRAVFGDTWIVDGTTGTVRLTVTLGTAVVVLLGSSYLAGHPRETEAYVLMLLAAIGAIALAASGDTLMLLAAYLLASVPLYALAGFAKDARGVEATLKYYLMGAFVGVLMLVGVAALVLAGGGTGYGELARRLPTAPVPLLAVGVLAVFAGVAFKAGAVPLHFWVPDVVSGTTGWAAAFITTIPKVGAVAAAFRLVAGPFADLPLNVSLLVAVIAAASMTLGNLAAFPQTDILRLLAYSTISQVGYLFMIVAVATSSDLASPALAIYLAAYAVTNLGAFAAATALPGRRTIAEWAGAAGRHRWLVLSLVVCLLGLVGTPPTAVFVGKLAAFTAAADGSLGWLVVVAAINTVASLFYYLRWIAPAFRATSSTTGGPEAGTRLATPAATIAYAAAPASLLLGVVAGIWLTAVSR